MPDVNAQLFDQIADGYDADVPFYATLGRSLVEWATPPPGSRVLDIGAGRGAITRTLAQACGSGGTIVAGDISPRMVDQLAALQLPGVQVRLLDATALDLPDASFDTVYAGFLLTSLPNPAPALLELVRVLEPGGSLVLSAPGPCADGGWWEHYGTIVDEFAGKIDPDRFGGLSVTPDDTPEIDGSAPDDTLGTAAPEIDAAALDGDPVGAGQPTECGHRPHTSPAELLEHVGLRFVEHTVAEVDLPLDGPDAYWRWLQGHGVQWLSDALSESDRAEFRRKVLHSLREHHPHAGKRLIAGAVFERLERLPA